MGYGGIETLLMNIYRSVDRNKIQFDFAVHTHEAGEYDDEIRKLGGNIYYFPKRGKHFINYRKKWKEFFKNHDKEFSAVHMHVSSLTNIEAIKMAKKYKIEKRFIHSHNTYQKGIIHNIFNVYHRISVDKYATKLLACSTEAGKYCFGNKKFELIKNGILAKEYEYNFETRKRMREQLKIEENHIAFVNVGRFFEQKNHTFLIEIFKEILKNNKNAYLFLVGEGNLREQINQKVKNLNIEKNVIFLGTRNDVKDILQAMDIFLLPSLHEGLPLVGIEAQASGLPVYTSNTVSPELKITDLVSFYSLEDNAEVWADNIMNSMKKFKRHSYYDELVKSGYDIDNTANLLEKYYID
jgi:glycosyltransferase involved in cell wall biosynthesis